MATPAPGGYMRVIRNLMSSPTFVATMLAPAVAGGVHVLGKGMAKREDAKQRAVSYRDMLELNPTLKTRDPKRIAQLYNSLSNVSPQLAKDPLVAGAWVNNIVENTHELGPEAGNQALLTAVKDMAGIRAQMSQARKSEQPATSLARGTHDFIHTFGKATELGMKSTMLAEREDINHAIATNNTNFLEREKELDAHRDELLTQAQALHAWGSELDARDKQSSAEPVPAVPTELEEYFLALGI